MIVCASCRALILAVLGAAATPLPFFLEAQPERPALLAAGAVLERRLAGGESHSYCLEAIPGARLLITVEQRGIDVEVLALRPDGTTLAAVDGPTDSEGPESLLLPADVSGPLEIKVHSPSPGAAPGAYRLRLEEVPESTPAERERVAAERLMTEAAAHNREGTGDSLRLGAARYEEAQGHWHALGQPQEEARCALSAGAIEVALGQPKPALERYQQALARFVELADEPGQAASWSGIGIAQTALGDAAGSVAAQRRALALEQGLGRPYEEGKVLNYLGLALHSHGELREALDLYQRSLGLLQRAGEQGLWKARVLHNLAAIYIDLGEPEAALQSHRQVLALQRAAGDRQGEAQTLNNLGVLFNNLGELGKALEAYAQALAIFRQSGDRLWEASLRHNLGVAYYGLGDVERALAEHEQALAIRREVGDRRGEVRTEVSLGHDHFSRGETEQALADAQTAARLAGEAADRGGEKIARLLLGQIEVATGKPAVALTELARARELARQLADRLDESTILLLTGQAYLGLQQPDQAAPLLAEAVELARAVKTPARIVTALTALSRAERMQGHTAAARSLLEEALGQIETVRAAESDPDLRASYLAARHAAFELEIDLLMELDRREPGRRQARAALEMSERARARSLLDLLQEADTDVREGVDAGLRDRQRNLLRRLKAKAGRQEDVLRRPATEKSQRAAEEEVRSVLAELTQVESEIHRQSPRYSNLTQPPLATSGEIQGLLDGETLLLEYSLGDERSFLWAVDRAGVAGFELPARARIEAEAREVYRRLSVLAPGDDGLAPAAASLGRTLLGPVAERLGKKRLIIVADGELQYIPFGMLPEPGGAEPLVSRHEIANAPSASAVALERRLARRAPAPGAVAVLADPVFDRQDPRVAPPAGTKSPLPVASAAERAASDIALLRLPWTRREAMAIRQVAPAGQSLLALDFRASRETALSPELSRYRIVHFATHGLIDSRTPALSGLMLSRVGPRGEPAEGFLGLSDVYNLRLGADLVVLSGCETALGKEVRGEGLVGLTQGFLYAGARQVVASLWRVEDQATAELMSRFYHGLLAEGLSPSAALRQAQLAIRGDKRWRSPYFWSGFVLQGDWEPALGLR